VPVAAPAAASIPGASPADLPGTPPPASAALPTWTPAAPAAPVLYGGFWRRVLAFIVDGLVVGAIMLPFGLGLGLAHLSAVFSEELTPEAIYSLMATSMFVWFIRVLVSWLYGAGFESSKFQATPGKMLLGLKVTDLQGRRVTFLRATGRALGKWLSGMILGIGYLLAAFTDRKQGLHDLMAGTLVRR
jgi:uncharacterized RDD family membrane protein YckC